VPQQTRHLTQADTDRVQAKLQVLYDPMPDEEQRILETLLHLFAEARLPEGLLATLPYSAPPPLHYRSPSPAACAHRDGAVLTDRRLQR
jgi:hypothetical protein